MILCTECGKTVTMPHPRDECIPKESKQTPLEEMLEQYMLFEEQVQEAVIPRWMKARLNGLNKQLKRLL